MKAAPGCSRGGGGGSAAPENSGAQPWLRHPRGWARPRCTQQHPYLCLRPHPAPAPLPPPWRAAPAGPIRSSPTCRGPPPLQARTGRPWSGHGSDPAAAAECSRAPGMGTSTGPARDHTGQPAPHCQHHTPHPRSLTADAGRVPPARRHCPHGHASQSLHQPRLLLRLQAPVAELPVPVGRCTRTDGRAPPAPGAHSPDAPRPPATPRLCSSARATAGSEGTGRPGHGRWWYTAGTGGAAWCSNYVQRNDARHNCNIMNMPLLCHLYLS